MQHANRTDAIAASLSALHRDLVRLPRGGKRWRAAFARYRRTDHWRARSAWKLAIFPFCQMCMLMGIRQKRATEVHHSQYNFFNEAIIGDLVSCCKVCHLAHEQRRMRKYRK